MHQNCKSQFSDFGRTNIFQEFNMDACKNVGQTNDKIMAKLPCYPEYA